MTVRELIERLSEFDPALRVVVCGFDEVGYDEPTLREMRIVFHDGYIPREHGRHEEAGAGQGEPAILIDH